VVGAEAAVEVEGERHLLAAVLRLQGFVAAKVSAGGLAAKVRHRLSLTRRPFSFADADVFCYSIQRRQLLARAQQALLYSVAAVRLVVGPLAVCWQVLVGAPLV
jgi:hypothetical protein